MPRERKGGVVTRDGKLYARVRFTDETGKQRAIWRKADNRTHARQILRALLKEIENSTPQQLDAANMTFAELADYYTAHYLQEAVYVGDRKVAGMRGVPQALCSVQPLKDYFGNRKLRSITYGDLRTYKQTRLQTPTIHDKQRSIAPVNRELSKLRRMFNIAAQQGWILKSPFHGGDTLISLADEKHRERILTRDEETRLLAAIDAEPKRAHLRGIVLIALDCALRRGEILTLRWLDIDLDRRTITVRAFNCKTARSRTVAMTGRVYADLQRRWLDSPPDENALVFGVRVSIKTAWGKVCRAAGVEDFHFHDTRHTAITRMVRAGIPPVEVMRVSGHQTLSCLYRYTNLDSDTVFRAAAAIDAFLAESTVTLEATNSLN
jgi:integrase